MKVSVRLCLSSLAWCGMELYSRWCIASGGKNDGLSYPVLPVIASLCAVGNQGDILMTMYNGRLWKTLPEDHRRARVGVSFGVTQSRGAGTNCYSDHCAGGAREARD